ncbi:glycosyltransferase [Arthrobacter sp.]|uniref:glycosyltransferase n=1 Tax=Arthrobacter sp. TaxID=1667 RepID=UPI00339B56F3
MSASLATEVTGVAAATADGAEQAVGATGAGGAAPPVRHIAVVVPVHNEEKLLGSCLRQVRRAMDVLQRERSACSVALTVVLDRCTDGSADIARDICAMDPRVAVVAGEFGSVGAARSAGIEAALHRAGRQSTAAMADVWVACTDADSAVPDHWLTGFAALADTGADAVTGTVEPEPASIPPALLRSWRTKYSAQEAHTRVHGANLGVRASTYLAVGGFTAAAEHEDVRLVEAIRAAGGAVLPSDQLQVVTSGRLRGRTPSGFAGYLARLQQTGH